MIHTRSAVCTDWGVQVMHRPSLIFAYTEFQIFMNLIVFYQTEYKPQAIQVNTINVEQIS